MSFSETKEMKFFWLGMVNPEVILGYIIVGHNQI